MGDLSEQHEKSYIIYCLESPNGKRYVGMTRCCRGEYNQRGGYIWKYKNEERSC